MHGAWLPHSCLTDAMRETLGHERFADSAALQYWFPVQHVATTFISLAMNYCSHCGAPVVLRIPSGDNLPRHICTQCNIVHYQNPKMVIGTLPEWQDKVLLCRRAIEPRAGFWTLPAGFMENAETTAQAAVRETLEEAHARIELGELYTLINVPHINQVHMMYRARLLNLDFSAGMETLEVALYDESDIPWREIAFRTVAMTLKHFYADRKAGEYRFRVGDITLPLTVSPEKALIPDSNQTPPVA